jgi:peroxiredoxin Q/BCP
MKTSRHLLCWICAVALAAAPPLLAGTLLKAGDNAPLFWGHDQDGNKWTLASHIGKKMVLLYFYPADNTAGCSAEACSLRDNMVEFKQAGVDVVGVSFDDKDSHKDFIFKYNLDFPLLADTNGAIADAYGARMDKGIKMDRRVTFLIGLDGKIIHVTDSPNPTVHLKEIALALANLSTKVSR